MRDIGAVVVLSACTHNVYTPPSRAFPLETPQTLKAGAYGGQFEVSQHGKSPDIGAAALRVRRGIEDNLEASVELTYAKATNATVADTSPHLFAARAGIRMRSEESGASVGGGIGAGTFAGGGFVTADVGAVFAYETCRFTPFIGGSAYVSRPTNAQEVDTSEEGMEKGKFVDTPETTGGVQVRVGVSVNVSSCESHDKAIIVGAGLDHFWDDDSDRGLASGGAAFQLNLD